MNTKLYPELALYAVLGTSAFVFAQSRASCPLRTAPASTALAETQKAAKVTTISPQQAQKMMGQGAALVDVREPSEWEEGHVKGGQLIPLGEVKAEPSKAAVAPQVLLLCRSGRRAQTAAEAMSGVKDVELFVIEGGIVGWKKAGLPTQKAAAKKVETKQSAAKEIRWLTSMDAAIAESQRSGLPILADFYADWCPPCQMMKKQTFPDAKLIAASKQWVMVKIDVDKQPDLAAKYQISSLPTMAVLNSSGQPVNGAMGFLSAADVIKMMRDTRAQALAKTDKK